MSKKILIIGAGDLGQLMAHHLKQDLSYDLIGFLDDTRELGEEVSGKPVLGEISELDNLKAEAKFDELLIAIGYKHMDFKEKLYQDLKAKNIKLASFVHKSSYLDPSVKLGEGSFILPGVTLDKDVELGACVLLNAGVTIAHDTKVGDFCFLGPAVNLAGFIEIAAKSFLGINTTVIDNIKISVPIQTGASATIVDNIDESGLYLGLPAKLKVRELS